MVIPRWWCGGGEESLKAPKLRHCRSAPPAKLANFKLSAAAFIYPHAALVEAPSTIEAARRTAELLDENHIVAHIGWAETVTVTVCGAGETLRTAAIVASPTSIVVIVAPVASAATKAEFSAAAFIYPNAALVIAPATIFAAWCAAQLALQCHAATGVNAAELVAVIGRFADYGLPTRTVLRLRCVGQRESSSEQYYSAKGYGKAQILGKHGMNILKLGGGNSELKPNCRRAS